MNDADTALEEIVDGLREIAGDLGRDERATGLILAASVLQDYRMGYDTSTALRGATNALGLEFLPPEPGRPHVCNVPDGD
jgi:hypothetical protein